MENVWKFLYYPQKEFNVQNLKNPNFIFLPNLKEENKSIEISTKDINKIKTFTIIINFVISEILNLNLLSDNFSFIKLSDKTNNIIEIKYNDINLDNKIISISKIFQVKFIFSKLNYKIIINNNEKVIEKKSNKFDYNSINEIEMLNNFFGEVSDIIIEKEYSSTFTKSRKLRIDLEKDITFDKIKINSVDSKEEIDEKEVFEKNKKKLFNYYGKLFYIKINCNNSLNNFKHIDKDLNNINKEVDIKIVKQ